MSTGGIVHCGLRYELMPVSMLISTAVPYCLLLKGVELLIFTTDKASGRAAVSQGGVGKRWKKITECFYDTSSILGLDTMLRKASVARVNRRLRRYYLIVRLLPNVFALACRS